MSTGKYELLIKWPSGQSTLIGEITDQQYGEICLVLSLDHCAELAALKAGQGEAVAEHCAEIIDGWRIVFAGRGPITPIVERHGLRIGSKLYAAPPASADAVSVPVAMPERWEDRLSRMHQTIQAGCWPKRWVDDAKDYELGELRALLAQSNGVKP